MKFKKLLVVGTVLTLAFGTLTVSASETKTEQNTEPVQAVQVVESPDVYDDEYSFLDELLEYAGDDIDQDKLEGIVKEINELEDQLDGLYEELFELEGLDVDGYFEDMGFDEDWEDYEEFELTEEDIPEIVEDIAADFKDDLSDAEVAEAKELIKKVMYAELEGNFEEADELWEQLEDLEVFDWEDYEDFEDIEEEVDTEE